MKVQCHRSRAFTLIELVISAALMVIILVAAYLCLSACIRGQDIVGPRADAFQNARVAMALLSADLRAACPLTPGPPFLGMQRLLGQVEADNLDFATHNYTPRRAGQGDFCEISYYVEQDPDGSYGLWRRRDPTLALDPLSGGSTEEIAENILAVRFEYFDGTDWHDSWGDVNDHGAQNSLEGAATETGLPEAVRITLMFDSDPHSKTTSDAGSRPVGPPLVFQTVAYLNLADIANNTGQSASQTQNKGASPQ